MSNITNANETYQNVLIVFSDITVASDKTLELNCGNFGRPKPIVVWFKNNELLNLTDEKFYLDNTGSLKIVRTHSIDSGKYECQVSNRIGKITRSFNVNVEANILTIKVKELTTKQIFLIVFISIVSFVLLVLLMMALAYVFYQKREHLNLVVNYFL